MSVSLPNQEILLGIARRAMAAVHPDQLLPDAVAAAFPDAPSRRTWVFGAGKAAAQMAAAFERAYHWPVTGFVITRHGFACETPAIEVVEAGHPVPDAAGLAATQRMMAAMAEVASGDRVVFLLSGGASALLSAPVSGLSVEAKRSLVRQLVNSGADIAEINTVRRALSAVKGGRLAALCKAPITTFAISDVVGDDPAVIGSGPTASCPPVDAAQVNALLNRLCDPELARAAAAVLASAATPLPPRPADRYLLLASAAHLMAAAQRELMAAGLNNITTRPDEQGDVIRVARNHADWIAQQSVSGMHVLLTGGELTASVAAEAMIGTGGPNQEYALALALAMPASYAFAAIALDSDGVDGSADAAGGYVDSNSAGVSLDIASHLSRHDSGTALEAMGGLIRTGPTGTNVNDLRIIVFRRW